MKEQSLYNHIVVLDHICEKHIGLDEFIFGWTLMLHEAGREDVYNWRHGDNTDRLSGTRCTSLAMTYVRMILAYTENDLPLSDLDICTSQWLDEMYAQATSIAT